MLVALFKQSHQTLWQRNTPAFMCLRRESNVFFATHMVGTLIEIDVLPGCESHFFIAATRTQEEFIANALFLVHRCE